MAGTVNVSYKGRRVTATVMQPGKRKMKVRLPSQMTVSVRTKTARTPTRAESIRHRRANRVGGLSYGDRYFGRRSMRSRRGQAQKTFKTGGLSQTRRARHSKIGYGRLVGVRRFSARLHPRGANGRFVKK